MAFAVDKLSDTRRPGNEPRASAPAVASSDAVTTLIPNSCIQFLDFRVSEVDAVRVRRRFFEDTGEATGEGPSLHAVAINEDIIHHPLTGDIVDASETYSVDGTQAFEPFLDCWLPVPYLLEAGKDDEGRPILDEGPTNWVRVYITRGGDAEERRAGYKVVLAFDTAIDRRNRAQNRAYAAPLLDDIKCGSTFRYSDDENDIAAFVSEVWIDDWLSSLYRDHYNKKSAAAGEEEWAGNCGLEHLAHYLTLLSVLRQGCQFPAIQFLDLAGEQPQWHAAGVDLVLDMGNSRTAALLNEKSPNAPSHERNKVSMLALRDISQPWRLNQEIFSSRLQFAKSAFGNEAWSRWSGRTNAFYWPSLARVGREAERLAAEQPASEDWTGLSSPMHYIWDDQPSPIAWRFARHSGSVERGALLSGLQLTHVSETGDVADLAEKRTAGTKPRFSRSSLVTFFAVELIVQTLSAINAPRRREDERVRVLERIVLTVPANLAPHEQLILKSRVEGAVQLVWRSLGWTEPDAKFAPRPPEVRFASDNASNAGLTYLHNELGYKFNGKVREYLDLMGKQRPEHKSGRSLRVASLDIGGCATCLSVATYELNEAGTLVQTPQIADGCRTGGDDILKAIIERHLMPALERRLIDCKLANAKRFLERIICGKGGKRHVWSSEFGRRFASEIALPLAISMLETHLGSRVHTDDMPIERTLGSLISLHAPEAKAVLDELDELATDEGADTFSPTETMISFRDRDIAFTIRTVLDPVLGNVARIVQALDCDVLLVSGWAARLPAVMDVLVERMPSQPNKIVPLSDYRVANWYTLRERAGIIGDSKSAAAMGAVLASSGFAAGGLPLSLRTLDPAASKLHVGRMSERGLVSNDTVLFVFGETGMAKDANGKDPKICTLSIDPPVLLGARRIELENWPATPMYWLDHEPADSKSKTRGPLKVTIERVPAERGQPETLRVIRACDADGNNLAPTEMALRLQTVKSPKGHWLDTGAIVIE